MKKTEIITDKAPGAIGPYSQGICVGDFVFTSGQLPMDPKTGELEMLDVKKAAHMALTNLSALLDAGGTSLDKVVKVTVFMKDLGNFAAVNEVYAEFFKGVTPARSTIEVAGLPKDAILEIEAIAHK